MRSRSPGERQTSLAANEPGVFAAALRRLRAAAGMTREALSLRAGVSVRGMANVERGARRG